MSALCWIAFYAVVKNTPAWCEQKWPKTAAIFPLESNPRSSLLTSVSFRFSVHTTQRKCHENLSDMRRFTFKTEAAQHRFAQKSIRNRRFVYERKPDPMCFWCGHKSYPVSECRHSLSLGVNPFPNRFEAGSEPFRE